MSPPDCATLMEKQWFSVRAVFRHLGEQSYSFEERIVLVKAETLDAALEVGERNALAYAEASGSEYLEYVDAFQIGSATPEDGSEVYSIMRDSSLEPSVYLDTFFDTGAERVQKSPSYSGSFLMEVINGTQKMDAKLERRVLALHAMHHGAFDRIARELTYSNLGKVEAYQLGRALFELTAKSNSNT
jgi:hypothetical protein